MQERVIGVVERESAVRRVAAENTSLDEFSKHDEELAGVEIAQYAISRECHIARIFGVRREHIGKIAVCGLKSSFLGAKGGAHAFDQDEVKRFGRESDFGSVLGAKRHGIANVAMMAIVDALRLGATEIVEYEFCSASIAINIF